MATVEILCKVCEKGTLTPQRVHRMSGPALVIGYILLIPSLLGVLLSGVFIILTWMGAATSATRPNVQVPFTLKQETRDSLRTAMVPADIIARLEKGEPLDESTVINLHSSQQSLIVQQAQKERQDYEKAQAEMNIAKTSALGCLGGCGTVFGVVGMILSFVGGLIGWLLVMKKNVLKCSTCGSVVATS